MVTLLLKSKGNKTNDKIRNYFQTLQTNRTQLPILLNSVNEISSLIYEASRVVLVVKNLPVNEGDIRDTG